MKAKLTELQETLLLGLILSGEEPSLSAKPKLTPKQRDPLVKQGFITIEKRGRSQHIVLTDKAWQWAAERSEVKTGTRQRRVLSAFMGKLRVHLEAQDLTLAEFVRNERFASPPPPPAPVQERIRTAYLSCSEGALQKRVRITSLRSALPDVDRTSFEAALRALEARRVATLFPMDNPREIEPADERDAVVVSGVKHHIVYLEA